MWLGFVVTVSDVEDGTETMGVVPLATARRVADSGVSRDDGRGGVNFNFLLSGCARISCQPIHTHHFNGHFAGEPWLSR